MMLYKELMESVLDEYGLSISMKNEILTEMDESIMDFIYESDLNLLDEGAVKDFVDKQIDKINGLTKLGLTRDDLSNSSKINAAIKKMPEFDEQVKKVKVKAIISLAISIVTLIVNAVLSAKADNAIEVDKMHGIINVGTDMITGGHGTSLPTNTSHKYIGGLFATLAVAIGNLVFAVTGLKTEYEKLISAIEKATHKINKQIKKEQKKDNPDKNYIKELEKTRDELIKNRKTVEVKLKKEMENYKNTH